MGQEEVCYITKKLYNFSSLYKYKSGTCVVLDIFVLNYVRNTKLDEDKFVDMGQLSRGSRFSISSVNFIGVLVTNILLCCLSSRDY